ncbi:MAG TPA: hypothetical protein VGM90_24725 [Kofleriaceae bacterium]|jgi:hypothetical protein
MGHEEIIVIHGQAMGTAGSRYSVITDGAMCAVPYRTTTCP